MNKKRRTRAFLGALLGCLTVAGLVGPAVSTPASAAQAPLWIGAAGNKPDSSIGSFVKANQIIGPLRYRRCFDKELPASFKDSCAKDDRSLGFRSFVSWHPPGFDHAGAARGAYDGQIRDWAKSVPTGIGLYATVWHEPETPGGPPGTTLTGQQYVAMYQHVYTVVKAANPSITFGPVYTAYWWHEGTNHYAPGGPNAWWVGGRYADFVAVDTYAAQPKALKYDAAFQGWLKFVNGKAPNKPLVVSEYGRYVVKNGTVPDPALQAVRARIIPVDENYLRSMRFTMWLYWHGTGEKGNWSLTDPASQAAWRTVASHGRR
ncbi:MAG: hypothetical protein ACR2KK_08310 [Acidimicrobiales bacterium]